MTFFHAPATVLTPDDNGDLPDVTGFVRAWTLSDDTAVIEADSVTGGTTLRTDADLGQNEKPALSARGLDAARVSLAQARRHIVARYSDENGEVANSGPHTGILTAIDNALTRVGTERGKAGADWPADSVRKVLLDRDENADDLGVDR